MDGCGVSLKGHVITIRVENKLICFGSSMGMVSVGVEECFIVPCYFEIRLQFHFSCDRIRNCGCDLELGA